VTGDTSQAQQYEEKSLAALQDLVAQGYKDLMTLETEPDLDPVRDRPAFQKLLADVKGQPAASASAKP
jgi:hypothetical protein